MATLRRLEVVWNGLSGLPGLSVFYSAAATDATASVATWLIAIKSLFPAPLSWTIPSSGDLISDATGQLVGGWTGGTPASISATGGGAYALGTGTFIRWGTGTIVGGRRLKGRTYLVPLSSNQYDTDGTIVGSSVSTINTPTASLVTLGDLQIWHRPTTPGGTDGTSSPANSGSCADKVTSLRTRRA